MARHSNDGSVKPVQQPKTLPTGEFQRPIGRQRKGMDWDPIRGVWVPQLVQVTSQVGGAYPTGQIDKEAGSKVAMQRPANAPKESMSEGKASDNVKPAAINPVQANVHPGQTGTAKPAAAQVGKNNQQLSTQSVIKRKEPSTTMTTTKPVGPTIKTSLNASSTTLKAGAAVSAVRGTSPKSRVSSAPHSSSAALDESNKPPPQCQQLSPVEQVFQSQAKPLSQCKESLLERQVAQSENNDISNTGKTIDSKLGTFRYVTVPNGVHEGTMFHVLLGGGNKIGVICPKGVKPGQTLILMEPGCDTAPIAPEKIAQMNEARLMEGFDGKEAAYRKHSFWEVLFPQLKAAGWAFMREEDYNFGAYTFIAPGGDKLFEKVADILKFAEDRHKDAVQEFRAFIEKQKKSVQRIEDRKRKLAQEELSENPTKKIRVGSKYQVRTLPKAGSHEPAASSDYM